MYKLYYISKFFINSSIKNSFVTFAVQEMSSDVNEQDNSSSNKQVQNDISSSKQEFKLPKLVPPPSRGRILSRKQNKHPVHFPLIGNQSNEISSFRNTQMININRNQTEHIKDDFASQVQEKLKMILGSEDDKNKENRGQQDNYHPEDDQIDLDFEQKIHQNKQLLKMQRQKNEKKVYSNQLNKIPQHNQKLNTKNKQKLTKPQSNYEKKMKDYNGSLQNKFLQRKKQSLGIIAQKQQKPVFPRAKSKKIVSMKDALQQAKANFGYRQFKSNGQISNGEVKDNQRTENKQGSKNGGIISHTKQLKGNASKRKTNQSRKTQINSPSKKANRTSALFDSIQSFLENPTAISKHEKFYKQLQKKLQNKDLNKLQQQVRQLNEKMGINEKNQTQSTLAKDQKDKPFLLTQSPFQRTVRDWKRVQVKDRHNLHYQESNFDKQMDYINYLQQKNSNSLSKFIDHQKIMIQLQINRRFSKSIGKQIVHEPSH